MTGWEHLKDIKKKGYEVTFLWVLLPVKDQEFSFLHSQPNFAPLPKWEHLLSYKHRTGHKPTKQKNPNQQKSLTETLSFCSTICLKPGQVVEHHLCFRGREEDFWSGNSINHDEKQLKIINFRGRSVVLHNKWVWKLGSNMCFLTASWISVWGFSSGLVWRAVPVKTNCYKPI